MEFVGLVFFKRFRLIKKITSVQTLSILIMLENWRIKITPCIKYPLLGFLEMAAIES